MLFNGAVENQRLVGGISVILALLLHGAVLFLWKSAPCKPLIPSLGEEGFVEVELCAPASISDAPALMPAAEESVLEEAPLAEPITELANLSIPQSTPAPTPALSPQRIVPPRVVRSSQLAPSSPKAKSDIRAQASSPGVASSSKLIAQPSFIVKPGANYPSKSQSAGEEGTVVLRITVNASGRPIDVRVVASSGFSRLDRAAVEGGWRCRIRNALAGDQFDVPVRFKIQK